MEEAGGFGLSEPVAGTVAVSGVLTFATASAALRQIDRALQGSVQRQLDLAGVSSCDSAGLACVLTVLAQAAQRGQAVRLVHPPSGLKSLARVCEVEALLG